MSLRVSSLCRSVSEGKGGDKFGIDISSVVVSYRMTYADRMSTGKRESVGGRTAHMRRGGNMLSESERAKPASHDEVVSRARELTAGIRESAAAAEEARTLSRDSVAALLGMGIARVLIPPRFGGYGLGFDSWVDALGEIGR